MKALPNRLIERSDCMARKRKNASLPIGEELLHSTFVVNNTTKIFHTPAVDKIIDQAMPLSHAGKGKQAEVLFRKALTLEPLQPDMLNNLANTLIMQELDDEGRSIIETTHILFPDYLFARTRLAIFAMREGDFEYASDLLVPLFSRREFHISEFNSLCSAAIEFSLLTGQPHSARLWFNTWSKPDPKNPQLDFYRGMLQKIDA
jgi:hypothetical protein